MNLLNSLPTLTNLLTHSPMGGMDKKLVVVTALQLKLQRDNHGILLQRVTNRPILRPDMVYCRMGGFVLHCNYTMK